jgi:glucosyl-dolichyl phosphate glucuronosyltransferase
MNINADISLEIDPLISIVVPTYNRAKLLDGLLYSVCTQIIDKSEYEIIVVDNNSTDSTKNVVERYKTKFKNIKYVYEAVQGNPNARNKGLEKAKGKYVSYVDDDCKFPATWLSEAKNIMELLSPGVFGGPLYPFYTINKPKWFKDSYGTYTLGDISTILENDFLFGANIFFRRELLVSSIPFNISMGRIGKNRGYGGEMGPQLYIRAQEPKETFYYSVNLYGYHWVNPNLMSLRGRVRERYSMGLATYRLFHGKYSKEYSNYDLFRSLIHLTEKFFRMSVYGMLYRDKTMYPFYKNYLYEEAFECFRHLGKIIEKYRQNRSDK